MSDEDLHEAMTCARATMAWLYESEPTKAAALRQMAYEAAVCKADADRCPEDRLAQALAEAMLEVLGEEIDRLCSPEAP